LKTVLVRPGIARLPNPVSYTENMDDRHSNDLITGFRFDPDELVELMKDASGVSKMTARAILEAFPQGSGLEEASVPMLEQLGANRKQAERILAAFRMVRVCDEACQGRVGDLPIKEPSDVESLLRREIGYRNQEYFVAVMLDARQRVIDLYGAAVGSLARVDVHPRELFRKAIQVGAHSIIIAHNHPTGDSSPSKADVELTERMVDVGRDVGIPVIDSLVITPNGFTSLAASGQM